MENKENNGKRGLGLRKDQSLQKQTPKGKSWFFGIGINKYTEFSNLNNAVGDIKTIKNLLVSKYDIEPDYALTIFDEDATRENIIDQLDVLVKKIQPNDKIIIYYSGHGHLDKNTDRGYWIPNDAKKGKTAKYIRNSTIREYIKDLKARHVLLISDSCFSGTLFVRGANRSLASIDELENIPSRWAICSGRHDEEVYDGNPGGNSPFAESIIETLSQNHKPVFNIVKLADRVIEQTRSNYQQLPEGNPLHGVGHKGGQYVFHLKKDEVADWKECVETGTLSAYNSFVLKYPDGKLLNDAKANIKKIKALELWKKIELAKANNLNETNKKLQLINQYVDSFENQSDYEKALDLGELLEYKKQFFLAQSSEFALRKFLRRTVPNVEGTSEIYSNAKQLLEKIDTESNEKRKAEQERLAELDRIRVEKEKEIAKQKELENQKLIEQKNLAAEKQQITKQQELKEKPIISEKKSTSQNKKYGIIAGVSFIGLVIVILIIRSFTGPKVCNDPVQIFKDNEGLSMGLKLCDKVIMPPTYDFIFLFSEGLAVAKKGNKFGFIDEKGTLVIDTIYERAESFSGGRALVTLNGKDFYINKNQKCVENCPDTKAEKEYERLIGLAEKNVKEGEYVFEKKAFDQAQKYFNSALKYYREAVGVAEDDKMAKEGIKKVGERLKEIEDEIAWAKAIKTNTIDSYKTYLAKFPNGKYKQNAKDRANKLSKPKYITDKRSGYKTVRLNGKIWFAENLNIKVTESWCYDGKEVNCHKYGRLYTWKAAEKACESYGRGWRLPKKWEWDDVIENAKTRSLNIMLGGSRSNVGLFSDLNKIGYYWHLAEDNQDNVFLFKMKQNRISSPGDRMEEKINGYSCRCLKEE